MSKCFIFRGGCGGIEVFNKINYEFHDGGIMIVVITKKHELFDNLDNQTTQLMKNLRN